MFKNIKGKWKGQLEEQAAHLKKKAEEAEANLRQTAKQVLADLDPLKNYLPQIQQIIQQKVLPLLSLRTLTQSIGEDRMEATFHMAYEFLPAPIRLMIGQEAFVRFCMNHRTHLVDLATEKQIAKTSTLTSGASPADELLKLKQLLDSGLLTEAEFETFKKQLLSA